MDKIIKYYISYLHLLFSHYGTLQSEKNCTYFVNLMTTYSVADPGFSRGGGVNPPGGA